MKIKTLPDYQPLPPVGEIDDLFDTRCDKCGHYFVDMEVNEDGLCVNCQETTTQQEKYGRSSKTNS